MSQPLIIYSTSDKTEAAKKLQAFLNDFPGIDLKVDGYPGGDTSGAVYTVFGFYLQGDPRNANASDDDNGTVTSGSSSEDSSAGDPSVENNSSNDSNDSTERYMPLVVFFKEKEGGLSRDPKDSASAYPCPTPYDGKTGWHTNKGITYKVWVANFGTNDDAGFFAMSDKDWGIIFKKRYWDTVKADSIKSTPIAFTLVSWGWGSGPVTAIKQMQGVVGVAKDGIIGPNTLGAINAQNPKQLFNKCLAAREAFFRYISNPDNGRTPAQKQRYQNNQRFLQGWLNRLNAFDKKFAP